MSGWRRLTDQCVEEMVRPWRWRWRMANRRLDGRFRTVHHVDQLLQDLLLVLLNLLHVFHSCVDDIGGRCWLWNGGDRHQHAASRSSLLLLVDLIENRIHSLFQIILQFEKRLSNRNGNRCGDRRCKRCGCLRVRIGMACRHLLSIGRVRKRLNGNRSLLSLIVEKTFG